MALSLSPTLSLPPMYSVSGLLTVYGEKMADPPSSSLMSLNRDDSSNQSLLKYELGDWAKEKNWTHHVDVIREEEGGVLWDYFWYVTTTGGSDECIATKWTGSSNRSPFFDLSLLPASKPAGPKSKRGVATHCWTSEVTGYGPVQQCYWKNAEDDEEIESVVLPWVFEGTGKCCPGANRWDFTDVTVIESFSTDFFDVPSDCTRYS